MFEVTLGEMVCSGRLKACSVVAGEQGLSRLVRGVLRIREPLVVGHLPVSFLIGADEDIFAGSTEHLGSFLRYCGRSRCAGVAVVSRGSDSILGAVAGVADKLDLPLIKVDPGQEIADWALSAANEIRMASAEKVNEVRRTEYQLRNQVLGGAGLDSIARSMGEHIGNPVFVTTTDRRLIAASWPDGIASSPEIAGYLLDAVQANAPVDEVEEDINARLRGIKPEVFRGRTRLRAYHKTVMADGRSVGTVRILEVEAPVERDDMQFLEYAASLVAVQVSKDIAVRQERMRLQGDLVHDLVEGRIAQESLQALVRTAGWDSRPEFLVIAIELSDARRTRGIAAAKGQSLLLEAVCKAFRLDSHRVLVGIVHDLVAVVLSRVSAKESVGALLERLKRVCDGSLAPLLVSMGVSEVFSEASDIPCRFLEACQALDLGSRLHGPGRVSHVSGVGAHRFLFGMTDKEMRSLITSELGPLGLDSDDASDLKETLLTYFRCDGSVAAAAKMCCLHPSTVKYRLSKIWGGRRPSYDEKVGVYLALLADSLLRRGFFR